MWAFILEASIISARLEKEEACGSDKHPFLSK